MKPIKIIVAEDECKVIGNGLKMPDWHLTDDFLLNFKPKTIAEEQGLIHLHNFYCIKGKCYDCGIGEKVFGNKKVSEAMRIIIY